MTWYAIADSGLVFCRVGTAGAIQTNPNPDDPFYLWTNQTSGVSEDLYGITWNGVYFIAVGANGTAIYSPDGITWNPNEGGVPAQDLNDIASLSNIVIAVGNAGTIIVSQWGGFWQTIPSGTSENLYGVSVGDSMYVAVGDNDTVIVGTLTSYDLDVHVTNGIYFNDPVSDSGTSSNVSPDVETIWVAEDQVNADHTFGSSDSSGTDGASAAGAILSQSELFANGDDAAVGGVINAYNMQIAEGVSVAESAAMEGSGAALLNIYNHQVNEGTQLTTAGTTVSFIYNSSLVDATYLYQFLGASNSDLLTDTVNATDSQGYITETIIGGVTGTTFVIEQEVAGVWAAFGRFQTDQLAFDEPEVGAIANFHDVLSDGTGINDATIDTLQLGAILSEDVVFDDTPTINQILNLLLTEEVVLATGFDFAGDTYRGVVMNLRNKAITEYDSYDFNSLGYWGGTAYGTKSDGVYRLEGADDAGVDIAAHILTAITNFGNSTSSRVERAYLGIRNDGTLTLKVIARQDDDTKVAHLYDMTEVGSTLRRERVKLGKGVRAAYFQFELSNTAGGDFEMDEMVFVPIALARRIT